MKKNNMPNPNQFEWKPRGEGFYTFLKLIEKPKKVLFYLLLLTLISALACYFTKLPYIYLIALLPIVFIAGIFATFFLMIKSRLHDRSLRNKKFDSLLKFPSKKFEKKWKHSKKKIPIEIAIEAYMNEKLDFKNDDVLKVLENRYELFNFSFTWGHFRSFLKDIIGKLWVHTSSADKRDVSGVYNRGNDFYGWFMDERMLYSSGIFEERHEALKAAQTRKLDKICNLMQLEPSKEHLDLGCGWGALITHSSKYFKAKTTGITLSSEQAKFCREQFKKNNVEKKAKVQVINAWDIPNTKKYDAISCVEMSEHIGIKKYQKFMRHVRELLKDDGIFYLQIAGLRRAWQYEDLVWGLYMGKYIFPGSDASCPLAWVIEQVERAGFEVHVVENNGVHYSLTIKRWYDNWVKNKDKVIKKYGVWWWRNWVIFLAWSYLIAAQGSSTVYMLSMTKNMANDKSSRSTSNQSAKPVLDRTEMWVTKEKRKKKKSSV